MKKRSKNPAIIFDDILRYFGFGWSIASDASEPQGMSGDFERTSGRISCAHALAEVFSTLTAHYKVPNDVAAEITLALTEKLAIEPLSLRDYETAISESRQRGVMGGGIYDSLHATYARHHAARSVVTRNPGDFQHVAPDLEIVVP